MFLFRMSIEQSRFGLFLFRDGLLNTHLVLLKDVYGNSMQFMSENIFIVPWAYSFVKMTFFLSSFQF